MTRVPITHCLLLSSQFVFILSLRARIRIRPARTRSAIDPYRGALQHLWEQGSHSPQQLWQHLVAQGFGGSYMLVYRWIQLQREVEKLSALTTRGSQSLPPPRHLAWLLVREKAKLDQQEGSTLSFICQDTQVRLAYRLAQQLVAMIKERTASHLESWLHACLVSEIAEIKKFALGLQWEFSAFRAALTLPYSNGPVEGQINR